MKLPAVKGSAVYRNSHFKLRTLFSQWEIDFILKHKQMAAVASHCFSL